MPKKLAISFLVCTRNRADIVYQCVLSLLASSRPDFEVIVRDNCSTDNTLELLNTIQDERLKIYSAPENQGTLTFYEASKLATGDIVTWLSDEDSFQFQNLDFILNQFREDFDCNVMFGGIIVGAKAREVKFPDAVITDKVLAHITALTFSGCGGLFVRRASLSMANSFDVRYPDEGYALWNYYPVGFFASRCLTGTLKLTSRVVVVQTRFAPTTNNWSKTSSLQYNFRVPHYYPESVFDRLSTNIVNVWFKNLSFLVKFEITLRLIHIFFKQTPGYANAALHELLYENYSQDVVQTYLNHIDALNLSDPIIQRLWFLRRALLILPLKVFYTSQNWKKDRKGPN